jgi:hypothetical protein
MQSEAFGWNKSKYVYLWFETMRLFQIILVNNLIPTAPHKLDNSQKADAEN